MDGRIMVALVVIAIIFACNLQANAYSEKDMIEEEEYYDSLSNIAAIAYCEARGESEYGIRLVIDCVLNRVDDPRFPDTINEVIWQMNQFSPINNGSINKSNPTDKIYALVEDELENRTNYDVLYFQAGGYSPYGTPAFRCGSHYFSYE